MLIIISEFFLRFFISFSFILSLFSRIFLIFFICVLFLFFILIKLKFTKLSDNVFTFLLSIGIILAIYILILLILNNVLVDWTLLVFNSINLTFDLVCWNYSLSIFKTKKRIYIATGLINVFLSLVLIVFFRLYLIVLIIFLIGFMAILISEKLMKKRGLMNYV